MEITFWNLLNDYHIEIPIIQRDYAQGRENRKVEDIRNNLIQSIFEAIDNPTKALDFDFVYGEIKVLKNESKDKILVPLDGQQRLTTLYLLHWYLASRQSCVKEKVGVKLQKFSYETRISSRDFCRALVKNIASIDWSLVKCLSDYIIDQPWFYQAWTYDPTVSGMLVMLNTIHNNFKDANGFWDKLISEEEPPIRFQFMDIEKIGQTEKLYIKMNARGKPLSPFENFKARLEQLINKKHNVVYRDNKPYSQYFAEKIDKEWIDFFWQLNKGNKKGLDECMFNFINYITEVLFYIKHSSSSELPQGFHVYELVYNDRESLSFLFEVLDSWVGEDTPKYFAQIFSGNRYEQNKVKLYTEKLDLLSDCCTNLNNFTIANKVLLYGVIINKLQPNDSFELNIRTLRNLIFNSSYELRYNNLGKILRATSSIMQTSLDAIEGFNGLQVEEEKVKHLFRITNKNNVDLLESLSHFEDHFLLRGNLSIIDILGEKLELKRQAFFKLWSCRNELYDEKRNLLQRVILAVGDYSQNLSGDTHWQFGANDDNVWRDLLTASSRYGFEKTKNVFSELLTIINKYPNKSIKDILENLISQYLDNYIEKDWRYYFIKYPTMNDGISGIYVFWPDADNFNICMLQKTRLNSYYRDPFLWTVYSQLTDVEKEKISQDHLWSYGYDKNPLQVNKTGVKLICGKREWVLQPPTNEKYVKQFEILIDKYDLKNSDLFVPNQDEDIVEAILPLWKEVLVM